jgi:hypothetical protein
VKDSVPFVVPVTDDTLVSFGMPESMRGKIKVVDKLLISGESVEKFSIFLNVDVVVSDTGASFSSTYHGRIDVTNVNHSRRFSMYLLANHKYKIMDGQEQSLTVPFYSYYDTATGACDSVNSYSYTNPTDGTITTSDSIQRTSVDTDGSISNVNVGSSSGQSQYVYAAYGDDIAGGIASLSSDSSPDNSGQTVTHNRYWGEYYGTNGDLLLRANGDTVHQSPLNSESKLVNLKAAPFNFTSAPAAPVQRSRWSSSTYDSNTQSSTNEQVTEVQALGGAWIPVSRYTWNWNGTTQQSTQTNEVYNFGTSSWDNTPVWGTSLVYKSGLTWSGGDTVYYQNESTYLNEGNNSYWIQTMYPGYVVPTAVAKFGKNYFVTNEYPLDAILPLASAYTTNYKLIQEEGDTSQWSWTDWEGKTQTSSYTNYSYYLNHTKNGENPIRLDSADGDINISDKLSSYEMYYWNNGKTDKVKGYFLRTTGNVPPYFTQPSATLIDRVDAKLNYVLEKARTLSGADFKTQLDISRGDPTAGKF